MPIVDPAGFPGFSKNPLRLLNRSPSRGQRNAKKKAGLPAAGLVAGSPFAALKPESPLSTKGKERGLRKNRFGLVWKKDWKGCPRKLYITSEAACSITGAPIWNHMASQTWASGWRGPGPGCSRCPSPRLLQEKRNMGRSNREASYSRFTIYRFPPFGKKGDGRPVRENQSSF